MNQIIEQALITAQDPDCNWNQDENDDTILVVGEIISDCANGIYQVRDGIDCLTDYLEIEIESEFLDENEEVNIYAEWIYEYLEELEEKAVDKLEKEFPEYGFSFGNTPDVGDYVMFVHIDKEKI